MTPRELEQVVLESDDVKHLYQTRIQLSKQISSVYSLLQRETNEQKRLIHKSNLSLYENLIDICRKREDDVREESLSFNKKFRIAAKKTLSSEMYHKICDTCNEVPSSPTTRNLFKTN